MGQKIYFNITKKRQINHYLNNLGGMLHKKYGRIADSPMIGAATYAKNSICAVSSTGWGGFFVRLNVAHEILALIEYKGLSVQQAADQVFQK